MALNIKDAEADRMARELARLTGESITVAARRAIAERLDRVRRRNAAATVADEVHGVIQRGRSRIVLDQRDQDQILGYDERGLPR